MATDFPPALVDLQRRAQAAWAAVEAHRLAVDARRREEAEPDTDRPKWASPALRLWTEEEDARHAELMAAVLEAEQARHAALAESGLGHGYDVIQDLHAAARQA